jgi:outer membrane protein assembly factor BamB
MISTERFLEILEEKDLLPAALLATLRSQIARASKPVPATLVAKKLIAQGHLTPALAKRLLTAENDEPLGLKSAAASLPPGDDEELRFADDGAASDVPPATVPRKSPQPPAEKQRSKKQSAKPPAAGVKPPIVQPAVGSLLDDELPTLSGGAALNPLDGLMSGGILDAGAEGSPLVSLAAKKGLGRFLPRFRPKAPDAKKEDWGSSLMLLGGGGLLLLVILGGVLLWALARGNADEMLQLATDDYRAGSYAQAINKFNVYLERFPNDSGAGTARVRIGMAKLHQITEERASWPAALQTANEVLADIGAEEALNEARGELAGILTKIAEGLAADARKKPGEVLVDQTRQTIALIDKYVPTGLRPATKLADVEDSLEQTVHNIARGNELDKTVAAMQQHVREKKTSEAYRRYNDLVRQYPDLADHAKLQEALDLTARAQQALVKIVKAVEVPEASERPTAALSSVTLAQTNTTAKVEGAAGRVVFVAVDGAVYGLDAATGGVLWRRFVGFDANPQAAAFSPLPLSAEPGADALLVDTAQNEVLRVEGATGRLRWRRAIGEPFDAHPLVVGDQVWVATRGGKLLALSAASGESSLAVQLPQALRVAPVVDSHRRLVFQVADHTNLFVLSADDGACQQVLSIRHQPGSAATAPVLLDDYLFLATNDDARDATLHVLAIQDRKPGVSDPALKIIQSIRLNGRVQTAPLAAGRNVLVATDRGARAFEISAADPKAPLHDVAETALAETGALMHFALLDGGQFWIADSQLTKYDVQVARGRLVPQWVAEEQSVFLQPPVAVAQAVISIRRKPGLAGALVSAVAMHDPDRLWETRLAAPLASEPFLHDEGKAAIAVTQSGAIFQLGAGQTTSAVDDKPLAAVDAGRLHEPLARPVALPNGQLAIAAQAGADQVGIFDPKQPSNRLRWWKTPGQLASPPIAFAGGLLLLEKTGTVSLLDFQGNPLAEPFQPRREPGAEFAWRVPAAINDKELVLADGAAQLYHLTLADQPKPHLSSPAQATVVSSPMVSPLAVVGQIAYAVDAANMLAAFQLPKLTRGIEFALPSRCVMGPVAVANYVLLATDDGQLFCLGEKGERLWQVPLSHGPLAGLPLRQGENYLLASRSGALWQVQSADGKELKKVEVGFPLGTGPVLFGNNLLIGGHDGTLYQVRQP